MGVGGGVSHGRGAEAVIHPLFLVAFWLSGDARDRDESDSGFASKEHPVWRGHSHDNRALLEDPQAKCRLPAPPTFLLGISFRKSRDQAGVFQHFCCISWLLTLFASHLVFLELFTYLFF